MNMWQRAKAGGVPDSLWWCLLAIVLFVAVVLGAYFIKEAVKARPRKIVKKQDESDSE